MFYFPEDGSKVGFRNVVLHQKLDDGLSPKKNRITSLSHIISSQPYRVQWIPDSFGSGRFTAVHKKS